MAIAFFGQTWVPATDNATTPLASSTPIAVTPPASMVAGQVVIMVATYLDATNASAISATGGQSWTSETNNVTTGLGTRLFSCVFNGTWTADPSVAFTSNANSLCIWMGVFSGVSNASRFDVSPTAEDWAAATSLTLTGFNTGCLLYTSDAADE